MPKCPKCGHILSQPAVSGDFDAFWKAYPRKIGKKAAQKAYQSAVKGHPGLSDAILVAVGLQKAWDAWRGGYIPNPMTWLNQGRWDDESGEARPEPQGGCEFTFIKGLPTLTDEELRHKHALAAKNPELVGLKDAYRAEILRREMGRRGMK